MATPTTDPLYFQPAAWSAALALVAIILSQLPPIRHILRGHKLDITTVQFCSLSHYLGNLQLLMYLRLRNSGGRDEHISAIHCAILRSDGHKWDLPIQTYVPGDKIGQLSSPGGQNPALILGWIALKPGESWNELVTAYLPWSESEDQEVNEIISLMRNDLQSKSIGVTRAEADGKIVHRVMQFFDKKFQLTRGTYQLLIAALSETEAPVSVIGYDFTLYESSIRDLRAVTDNYKYGIGVCLPNNDQTMGSTSIRLSKDRQIASDRAMVIYEQYFPKRKKNG